MTSLLCAGLRTLTADAPDLPFTCNAAQLATAQQRSIAMRLKDSISCMPTGVAHIQFEKALGMPGTVKTHEYLLLAGPIGKYLLEGCFHPDQQAAIFEYLDIMGSLWEKSVTLKQLDQLERDIPRLLTQLSFLLPTWSRT